jgi:hypothetical protein
MCEALSLLNGKDQALAAQHLRHAIEAAKSSASTSYLVTENGRAA